MENWNGVRIDPSLDDTLSEITKDLLSGFYKNESEGYQGTIARAALAYSDSLEMAQEIYEDVARRKWAMYSSPIVSNAPMPGERHKAMPIACYLGYVGDNKKSLVSHQSELGWLSMMGGGFGGHWSAVRSASEKSVGVMPHLKVGDSGVEAFRQGKTRKGSYAAYLEVSNPDLLEFLYMRSPTGGDINRKCFNIHHAVNITDDFMLSVINGFSWSLSCPHTGKVTETLEARSLFEWIIKTRFRTGEPYLNFIDTANRHLPEALKALGLRIHGSNLCNEIHQPTSEDRTAVCCLSSVNLAKYDEWKNDPYFIYRWTRFLDNVITRFIEDAPAPLKKAVASAYRERSLGLGAMGFHTYLQEKMIPWESEQARYENRRIFQHIHREANDATLALGRERGEAPDMVGTGRRNAHVLAVAPNANSSLLMMVSPSIEMIRSNAFTQRTRAGSHLIVNPLLMKNIRENVPSKFMLEPLGISEEDWIDQQVQSVVREKGSCQHLTYLSDEVKRVLRTAFESDARWSIIHAGDRQPYICQGQSVNLYYPFGSDINKVMADHILAWQYGLKGLYYLRTDSGFSGDKVGEKLERIALRDYKPNEEEECTSCHA